MADIKFCKIDRYSNKYSDIFYSEPPYCKECNGDLIGAKCIENDKDLFFLICRNCNKKVGLKK